ncbi:hypothetical protein WR25_07157 [Diploscapter pachys]|uniref:Uncharacterized protein n=1 Tax=Diploscapter pachys TaxID=2018661 RepID=A0A2A2J235_9BILA|nr:hypothetical protein WR25_07157 [Diploscapter pachys]
MDGTLVEQRLPTMENYMNILHNMKSLLISDDWLENCTQYAITNDEFDFMAMNIGILLIFYAITCCLFVVKTHSRMFALAMIVLFLGGDFIMMAMVASRKRARISCVVEGLAEKNLARQTVGTIALEMSNSIVLAMSVYLFVRGCSTDANFYNFTLFCGMILSIMWSLGMAIAHHKGFVKQIWYENSRYKEGYRWPFNVIREPIMILFPAVAMIFYMVTLTKTVKNGYIRLTFDSPEHKEYMYQCKFVFAKVSLNISE